MQTDFLLKQLYSSLGELKTSIEKFEKHPSPSTQYAEQLHKSIQQSNKLVSAFLVIKEHKEISPDINLHMKIMNAPTPEEKAVIIEPIKEPEVIKVVEEIKPVEIIKPMEELKPVEEIKPVVTEQPSSFNEPQEKTPVKEYPKILVNINDKFRFINELFAANANEYNIAVEQINRVKNIDELTTYLNGLKTIYGWDEKNEVVKNIYALANKRFA